MFIDNGGHSTASGPDVIDRQAGVGGGVGNGSVKVNALIPQWVCSAGARKRKAQAVA
jgi:hypothetical protein